MSMIVSNLCLSRSGRLYLSYITQMTSTTNFAFKEYSHDQKRKIQIFERPPPSNSPEIVHHTFRHNTLIVCEDPSFWSAEQLEHVFKIQICFQVLATNLWGILDLHNVTLPHHAPSLPPPSPRDYKWVIIEYFCYFQVFLLHTKKKQK